MPDTSTLIQRWQAGDERAAEALYNQFREPTFRLAFGLLGDPFDAEEAAQDALAYALTNIRRYDPQRAAFSTWLHTITVSRCRDRQRRRRLPILSWIAWKRERGEDEPADAASTPEHRAIRKEARSEVWQAVQSLSPLLREAILLRYWAGHTYREMAEISNCPLPTAQSRVRLASEQLRQVLTPADLAVLEESEA